jgi:hypothetical protein
MELIIALVYILALFQHHHVLFLGHPSHLGYLHMEDHTLGEACTLGLPHYLGLTLTSKRMGLIPIVDFPSGPRPYHSGLPSPISRPNHKLHLIQRLRASKPPPQAPFFKPSLVNTYGHNCGWGTQKECLTPKCRNLNIGFTINYECEGP